MSKHSFDERHEPYALPDNPGYETRDVPASKVFWPLFILGVFTLVSAIALIYVFKAIYALPSPGDRSLSPVAQQRPLPPLPRLQAQPPLELKALHAREEEKLNGYAWVDQHAGIVQIPVDHALELIAERGLPHGREAHVPSAIAAPAGTTVPAQSDAGHAPADTGAAHP